MKIGIMGINRISKFYAILLSQYGHEVLLYENESPINNLAVEKIILEESFFNTYIKDLKIFEKIEIEKIEIDITEKFFFKENTVKENFVYIKKYEYKKNIKIDTIPNIEIIPSHSDSINQIKMMEDILIIDTPDNNLLKQMDLIKLNNWLTLYIQAPKQDNNFQITREGKYSILAINEKDYMEIFINTKEINRNKVLKLINKKCNSYKLLDEQTIQKYDNYSYKNIAIINTALVECNYPYRDYSLLFQIIQSTQDKKIYANLDIYSDIKSKVI